MARTEGHGNPKWRREEIILALDLYFECNGRVPSSTDQRVVELSGFLRRLTLHANSSKNDSFRNPSGVVFKLQNIRQVDTGKGLSNISGTDRQVWNELGANPEEVRRIASQIRSAVEILESTESTEVEDQFAEGGIVTEAHRKRERNPNVRRKLLESRRQLGGLSCDVCSTASWSSDPLLNEAMFEGHHIVPLSMSRETITRISDLALVCANCHRLIHKAISQERRWIRIEEARQIFGIPAKVPPLRMSLLRATYMPGSCSRLIMGTK